MVPMLFTLHKSLRIIILLVILYGHFPAAAQISRFGGLVIGSANQDFIGLLFGKERIIWNACPGKSMLLGQELGLHLNLRASEFFRLRGDLIEEWRPFLSYTGYAMYGMRVRDWRLLGGAGLGFSAAFGPEIRERQLLSCSVLARAGLQWRNIRVLADPVYSPLNEYGGVYRAVNYSRISGKISLIWLWQSGKRRRELPCLCW